MGTQKGGGLLTQESPKPFASREAQLSAVPGFPPYTPAALGPSPEAPFIKKGHMLTSCVTPKSPGFI